MLRALGYKSGTDFAWDSAWTLSDSLGLTKGEYNAKTENFLRADVALISKDALDQKLKGEDKTLLAVVRPDLADAAVSLEWIYPIQYFSTGKVRLDGVMYLCSNVTDAYGLYRDAETGELYAPAYSCLEPILMRPDCYVDALPVGYLESREIWGWARFRYEQDQTVFHYDGDAITITRSGRTLTDVKADELQEGKVVTLDNGIRSTRCGDRAVYNVEDVVRYFGLERKVSLREEEDREHRIEWCLEVRIDEDLDVPARKDTKVEITLPKTPVDSRSMNVFENLNLTYGDINRILSIDYAVEGQTVTFTARVKRNGSVSRSDVITRNTLNGQVHFALYNEAGELADEFSMSGEFPTYTSEITMTKSVWLVEPGKYTLKVQDEYHYWPDGAQSYYEYKDVK